MSANLPHESRAERHTGMWGIRTRMLVSFGVILSLAIGLVVVALIFGIPFTACTGSYQSERARVLDYLSLAADWKKDRLEQWLNERKRDLRDLSGSHYVASLTRQVSESFGKTAADGIPEPELGTALRSQESTRRLSDRLKWAREIYKDYDKIRIIDPKTGLILASDHYDETGTRCSAHSCVLEASRSTDPVLVKVVQTPGSEKTYLVICTAMVDRFSPDQAGETLPAFIALYIDTEHFVRPLLYTGRGFGKTEDIVLVDRDRRVLMTPRFALPDGTVPKVLEFKVDTEPVRLALLRRDGIAVAEDYRKVRVIAAYRYVNLTQDSGWGMVVKIDESEVIGPVWDHVWYSFLMGSVGLLTTLGLVFFTAHRILQPLRILGKTAKEVRSGNLAVRAGLDRTDELGDLAAAFDSMLERIENWHEEMEAKVKERTAQLNNLNQELAAEIADRKNVDRALTAERQRLAITLRSIGDGVITADTTGRVVSLNGVGERLTGWTETEARDMPLEEVFHIVNEITRQRCENPVQKVLERGQIVGLANGTVLIARDGTERIIADSAAPVRDEDGNVYGVVLVFRDITGARESEKALIESEERFRQLAENVQDVFWLTEPGKPKRVIYLNPAHDRMWGFSREEAYTHRGRWLRSIHEADRERIVETYEVFLRGEGEYDVEFRIVKPDGSVRWIWDRAFPIKDSRGKIFRVAGLAQDVTQRKLDQQRQEELGKEIRHFAYIVSHDLRAPLTNLKGFSDELEAALEVVRPLAQKSVSCLSEDEREALRVALEEDVPESLRFMAASVSRMNHLITAILALSRLGYRQLDFQPLDMDELVSETLETMAHQTSRVGARVTVHPLPAIVADKTSLEQIISNLLANAINYLDRERPGDIDISGERRGDETFFFVRDNGIGIEPQNLEKVFEIFQRVRKLDVPGEGMGLAYVRTMVRRHGGRIWCDSEPGVGSTFTFTVAHGLPRE